MVAADVPMAPVPTGVAVPSGRRAIVAVVTAAVLTQGRSAFPAALALVPADAHAIPRENGPIGPSAVVGPDASPAPRRMDQAFAAFILAVHKGANPFGTAKINVEDDLKS